MSNLLRTEFEFLIKNAQPDHRGAPAAAGGCVRHEYSSLAHYEDSDINCLLLSLRPLRPAGQ